MYSIHFSDVLPCDLLLPTAEKQILPLITTDLVHYGYLYVC